MPGAGVSLGGLGLIAAGGVLLWSGINDPKGGPVGVVRDVLQGRTPTPGVVTLGRALGTGVDSSGGTVTLGKALGGNGSGGAEVASGSNGARIVAAAQGMLGVPYVFGGAGPRGVDCSGLVLIAYRDGAGIVLPHLATAQAARGQRVPREQVHPGDMVAWGVPGNYPHIAIATGYDQVIVAPHTGTVVQYQPLWEKKVPGFGYPDIYRIPGVT